MGYLPLVHLFLDRFFEGVVLFEQLRVGRVDIVSRWVGEHLIQLGHLTFEALYFLLYIGNCILGFTNLTIELLLFEVRLLAIRYASGVG